MKLRKTVFGLLILLACGAGVFIQQLSEVLNREPYTSRGSSGRYLLQHVHAGNLFIPFRHLGYLQVVDLQNPQRVYRSPLIYDDSLDMRMSESARELSIFGVTFNTETKTYFIQWRDWEPHWLNWFISNTPYGVCSDAEGTCF
ncbi:hypothetical protein JFV28_11040 [Pseudomonas sp. TH05]|uniref:hypothetical protein n=1 Tax=unclassified Pseudomonas TaxID=196821 RepID=UPI000996800C|nr:MULTISPECIES: hypothetical protein [unclassified Pseudomonas]MBK5539271.1 hypothetical protein [Pseudomonas sp. TH07]MBK5556400.1 hypothetical protein [Pseudomonas sp. TH05]OOV98412.1 hypothetical protein MF4836_08665 [Pseudomonas sp. MF4836]